MKQDKMLQIKLHEEKKHELMELHLRGFLRIGTFVFSLFMVIVVLWLLHLLGRI